MTDSTDNRSEQLDIDSGWEATINQLQQRAAELKEEGQDVIAMQAAHSSGMVPSDGSTDRWGLVHVVPGEKAAEFESIREENTPSGYQVFQRIVGDRLFLITEVHFSSSGTSVLVAGNFPVSEVAPVVDIAEANDNLQIFIETLDRTVAGSFSFDDISRFFPDRDVYSQRIGRDGALE